MIHLSELKSRCCLLYSSVDFMILFIGSVAGAAPSEVSSMGDMYTLSSSIRPVLMKEVRTFGPPSTSNCCISLFPNSSRRVVRSQVSFVFGTVRIWTPRVARKLIFSDWVWSVWGVVTMRVWASKVLRIILSVGILRLVSRIILRGCLFQSRSGMRTVSSGSSAITVSTPTRIAWHRRRNWWTSFLLDWFDIHRFVFDARKWSALCAHFAITHGLLVWACL